MIVVRSVRISATSRKVASTFFLATLLLTICAGCVSTSTNHPALRLYAKTDPKPAIDPNGFLLNPRWADNVNRPDIEDRCRFRVETLELELRELRTTRGPCLSDDERQLVTLNEPGPAVTFGLVCKTSSILGSVRGHVNWFPVTVAGRLRWVGYSSGVGDHDLTIDLVAGTPNASTSRNTDAYHIEFYHGETLVRLGPAAKGWWSELNRAMALPSHARDSVAGEQVNNHFAIATGTFGLDGVHGFHAELHPVFALAVLVNSELVGAEQTEEWALLVRNIGNEGDCATGKLPFTTQRFSTQPSADGRQDYVVNLGWLEGASSAIVKLGPSWAVDDRMPTARLIRDSAVLLNVRHPRPVSADRDYLFLGTIKLQWIGGAGDNPLKRFKALAATADISVGQIQSLAQNVKDKGKQMGVTDARQSRVIDSVLSTQAPLQLLPEALLLPIDSVWRPSTDVLVYRSVTWLAATLPGHVDCRKERPERICQGRFRLAAEFASTRGWDLEGLLLPNFSIFLHAHSWRWEKKGWSTASEFLSTVAWRIGERSERFHQKSDPVDHWHTGRSLRLSPILAPNTWRPREGVQLTPYIIGSVGVTTLSDKRLGPTLSSGIGLSALVKRCDLYFELQRYTRARDYDGHSAFSAGILLPLSLRRN